MPFVEVGLVRMMLDGVALLGWCCLEGAVLILLIEIVLVRMLLV